MHQGAVRGWVASAFGLGADFAESGGPFSRILDSEQLVGIPWDLPETLPVALTMSI